MFEDLAGHGVMAVVCDRRLVQFGSKTAAARHASEAEEEGSDREIVRQRDSQAQTGYSLVGQG